jgi:dTMP kinase
VSRERLQRAENGGHTLDKFESERQDFFERVRNAYLERAAAEPARFRVVDASRPVPTVRAELSTVLAGL